MQALVVEFRIHPGFESAFETAICENARRSLEDEPGCHVFDVCRDPGDPALFFLYELYSDEAAVQAHLDAPHFKSMSTQTASWVASKRVQRLTRL